MYDTSFLPTLYVTLTLTLSHSITGVVAGGASAGFGGHAPQALSLGGLCQLGFCHTFHIRLLISDHFNGRYHTILGRICSVPRGTGSSPAFFVAFFWIGPSSTSR